MAVQIKKRMLGLLRPAVTRTLWTVDCECEQHYEWTDNPPKEIRCKCGKWNVPKATSFTSKEYKK